MTEGSRCHGHRTPTGRGRLCDTVRAVTTLEPAIRVPEPSPDLHRTIADLGQDASRWLAEVPTLVARVADAWELALGRQIEHSGHASIVLAATTSGGEPAMLKLSVPHDEARHEATALSRWNGNGAVRLLRRSEDGFVLLLERCDPGRDLWSVDIEEQVDVLADVFPRLWVPGDGDGLPTLADTCRRWEREMAAKATALGVPADVADRARGWAARLAVDQPERLLHGDLHPGNVLAARHGAWLAIDPKPWVGDPAFDLAQLLANWVGRGVTRSPAGIRRLATGLATRLNLDVDRVLRWAVVKAIGWDFGADQAVVLDAAARSSPTPREPRTSPRPSGPPA